MENRDVFIDENGKKWIAITPFEYSFTDKCGSQIAYPTKNGDKYLDVTHDVWNIMLIPADTEIINCTAETLAEGQSQYINKNSGLERTPEDCTELYDSHNCSILSKESAKRHRGGLLPKNQVL